MRSVACGGKLVLSGGADETINIYNMQARKECGMLLEHNGKQIVIVIVIKPQNVSYIRPSFSGLQTITI